DHVTATAFEADQITGLQPMPMQFIGVQAQNGFADMPEQLCGSAGAAHTVPLIAQTPGDQGQREASVTLLFGGAVGISYEVRPTAGCREYAVAVQARRADLCPMGEGPLLWTDFVEQGMTDAGQVEVAVAGQLFVFIEYLRRIVEGEQAWLCRAQALLQALSEVYCDRPVSPCFS